MSFFLVFSFFFFFFLGGDVYRSAEVGGRFWVGNKRRKNKTKHFLIKMKKKKKKKGTVQAYFHLSIQSGLVCRPNGKMKLKSDIRIKILNDRYRPINRPIGPTYLRKKQTSKQTKTKTKKIM